MLLNLQAKIASAEETASHIRFEKTSSFDHFSVGLFVAVVERASAVRLLLEAGHCNEAKLILRSALELLVEIELLASDRTHIWNVQFEFCKKQLLLLNKAEAGNPYLYEIKLNFDLSEQRALWENKLEQIKNEGGKSVKVEKRFALTGRQAEYDALYRSFSQSVHASYSGIINDVFAVDQLKSDFEVSLYEPQSEEAVDLIADTMSACLDAAEKAISPYVKRP